jgi:DNA-binding CsgD family transcriptional regulator
MRSWASRHEAYVKKVRVFSNVVNREVKKEEPQPTFFVFCEKTTGVAQFRAGSLADSDCTLDRVAGLFAMQCLVRGHDPNDFTVLVPADKEFVGKLVTRAKDLLEEGRAVSGPASLSPRQQEILHSVLCNRANKEIASKLNITVRTVKFHISSLLSKFGVENRTELARRAAGLLRPTVLEGGASSASAQTPVEAEKARRELGPQPVNTNYRVENKARLRFQGRVLTA